MGIKYFNFLILPVPNVTVKTDIVRQAAQLYDEYKGNEEYIHIPDISQMLYNLQHYPVLVAFNIETGDLEGIITIKYHENTQGDIDPYYPKDGVSFFSATGVIVKQTGNMLKKGMGTSLYEASILGIQKYVQKHQEQNIELNVVIDCTNLPSLYALEHAIQRIQAREHVGRGRKLEAILDGIYTVRDEKNHLVEAPTYSLKVDLNPKNISGESWKTEEEKIADNKTFSFQATSKERHKKYEELLDTILGVVKQNQTCMATQMEDEDAGTVTYISLEDLKIYIEDMRIERNGTEEIGKKRIPRGDVHKFVGPMPNVIISKREDEER